MSGDKSERQRAPTIAELYPHLNEEELKEAEQNLDRYLEVVLRIYERLQRDQESHVVLTPLTNSPNGAAMESERSTNQNTLSPEA